MNKRLLAFITGFSYILPALTVLQYEAKTSLYRRLAADRPAVEQTIREHQTTVSGGFDEAAFNANVDHVFGDYSDAYPCQSKMDTTKCRSAATY